MYHEKVLRAAFLSPQCGKQSRARTATEREIILKTAVVVSGGDAPGINAVLATYTGHAARNNDQVVGVVGGMPGLLKGDVVPLELRQIALFAEQPGTYLASSREPVLNQDGAQEQLLSVLDHHNIDNVVLIGGNGTMHYVLPLLIQWGVKCVGIPVTIDNDVPGTERTLGFDSACNYAYQTIDGVRATARALPGRMFMVETLGGDTGLLALDIALGAGACAALVPEYEYANDWLARRLLDAIQWDGHALLVLAEGVPASRALYDEIPQWTGIRMRDIRLGHGQRGGKPTHIDRALAANFARLAYHALRDGCHNGVVVVRKGETFLHEVTLQGFPRPLPDLTLYCQINGLSRSDIPDSH
jgi:6-phosphofructokinase 1